MRKYSNYEYNFDLIESEIKPQTDIIIIIPSYYEKDILSTLESLLECDYYKCNVEVIIVINQSKESPDNVSSFHHQQFSDLLLWSERNNNPKISFFPIIITDIPPKHAGVGIARKTGMDEAYKRFSKINNLNGLIVSLDADTIVSKNYLQTIEIEYNTDNITKAFSIYFEHLINNKLPHKSAIIDYELHLRYYINMQRLYNLPFAFYTIGSAMAVRAFAYGESFGMNKRQAGEDFYFLHKFIKTWYFKEINNTAVYPSHAYRTEYLLAQENLSIKLIKKILN
ncbi:MAG: glycosyltransferase family A protein [Saprospiraceae bacterium]